MIKEIFLISLFFTWLVLSIVNLSKLMNEENPTYKDMVIKQILYRMGSVISIFFSSFLILKHIVKLIELLWL